MIDTHIIDSLYNTYVTHCVYCRYIIVNRSIVENSKHLIDNKPRQTKYPRNCEYTRNVETSCNNFHVMKERKREIFIYTHIYIYIAKK